MRLLQITAPSFAFVLLAAFWSAAADIPAAWAQPESGPAPASLVVFSDFGCPFSSDTFFELRKLQARDPGHLHIVFKHSPLPIHASAPLAHRAALAAGKQGKFEAMAELLFANQKRQERPALLSYARRLHLDMVRFTRDMDSSAVKQELAENIEEAHAFGVTLTPTMFLNGQTLTGLQNEGKLIALLEKAGSAPSPPALLASAAAGEVLDVASIAAIQNQPGAVQGADNAPLTLVEFTDFQCPFCRAAVQPMEQLMAERGQQVRWIFRSFPLDFHPDAELAAEAAMAAGDQGKFWPMHDLLFAHQNALKMSDLRSYAQQLQLNMPAFDDALMTHRFAAQVAADRALGLRAGVSGTPTFIVDGRLVTGVRSLPELRQMAEAHSHGSVPAPLLANTSGRPADVASAEHVVLQSPRADAATLTWFTDVRSPLAARQAELIRSLSSRYEGRLRVVFKAYALPAHADAALSSAALFAALKQNAFWSMFDAVAERRDTLNETKLLAMASSMKLDLNAFRADLHEMSGAVLADGADAVRRGIQGAPVIFINAQRIDGLQREAIYSGMLDAELKAAPIQTAPAQAAPIQAMPVQAATR